MEANAFALEVQTMRLLHSSLNRRGAGLAAAFEGPRGGDPKSQLEPLMGRSPRHRPIMAEGAGAVSFEITIDRDADIPQEGEGGTPPPPGAENPEVIGTPKPGEPSPIDPCCEGGDPQVCRDAGALAQVCQQWSQCCDGQWEARCSERYHGLSNLCHGPKMGPRQGR